MLIYSAGRNRTDQKKENSIPEDEGFPLDEILDLWDEYQAAVESVRNPVTREEVT